MDELYPFTISIWQEVSGKREDGRSFTRASWKEMARCKNEDLALEVAACLHMHYRFVKVSGLSHQVIAWYPDEETVRRELR